VKTKPNPEFHSIPVNVLKKEEKKPNGMSHIMRARVLFYYFFMNSIMMTEPEPNKENVQSKQTPQVNTSSKIEDNSNDTRHAKSARVSFQ
jgi:hypothetical protein